MCERAALYGLDHSNRNFSDRYYWGKNQFNSSFPAALACYMRDQRHNALYIKHAAEKRTAIEELPFEEVFGSTLSNNELFFSFEDVFLPYRRFVRDTLKPIDLVIKNAATEDPIRPLEIKLTVLPDNTTADNDEEGYGAELVIRSPTMRYMAMSMAEACETRFGEINEIFAPVCSRIRDWNVSETMQRNKVGIFEALESFIETFRDLERPLLMQPVWKTVGKSSQLAENCLDIFIWSDFALTRLFMDSAISGGSDDKITRQQRASFRLARFLYEISSSVGHNVYQEPIYDGMNYNTLNDKEFAISGSKTNQYLRCERLVRPVVTKQEIRNIVLGGGQRLLSPERRFDAILYFSTDIFE